MATLKSQDNAPASSSSHFPEIYNGFVTTLKKHFDAAWDRVVPPYRERLCEFERSMYDEFHLRQKRHPEDRVFLVIADPTNGAERFESAKAEDAKKLVADIRAGKNGAYAFIGLDLSKDFESQWTASPDGTGTAIAMAKIHTYNRAPAVMLLSPSQERSAQTRRVIRP
jgi:hypothetical protein